MASVAAGHGPDHINLVVTLAPDNGCFTELVSRLCQAGHCLRRTATRNRTTAVGASRPCVDCGRSQPAHVDVVRAPDKLRKRAVKLGDCQSASICPGESHSPIAARRVSS